MKKILVIFLAIVAGLFVFAAACAKEPAAEETQTASGTLAEGTVDDVTGETVTSGEKTITGTITGGGNMTVAITGDDGVEYDIVREGANTDGLADGLLEGAKITVVYVEEGELLRAISIADAK